MRASAPALLVSLALAVGLSAPARAQGNLGDPAIGSAIVAAQDAAGKDDCASVLRELDSVVDRIPKGTERVMVQRMRLICLGMSGRVGEMPAVQQELAQAMPRDGMIKAFGVLIAADENRFSDAAEQIATIADTSPRSLDVVTGATVRDISLKLAESHAHDGVRARMMIALARADWEPSDLPELKLGFTEGAIDALIDQGDNVEAEGLLERIEQPEILSSMMIDRHYAKLWPALGTKLGPGGTNSVDRFARDKLALFGDSPNTDGTLRDATNAMLLLGRYQDVVDMTDQIEVAEGISRDRVRTLLYRARALATLRRYDEVDRLFAAFLPLDVRKSPAAPTALLSYAEFLDEIGRPEKALIIARDTKAKAGEMLTDLGRLWLDRTEICTLSTLGRTAEANSAIQAIKAQAALNQAAAVEALLCAKRDVEASKIAVKAFDDSEAVSDLIIQFQPAASLWASSPSRLRDLWVAFLARPEIKAAFERKARILPRTYWPDPKPRSIPRRPSNGAELT